MRKTVRWCGVVTVFVLIGLVFLLPVGCEKDSKGTGALTITPSEVTLVAATCTRQSESVPFGIRKVYHPEA